GVYSLSVTTAGTFPVTCNKVGFQTFTSAPVSFQPGITSVINIGLLENLNPPVAAQAIFDSASQLVSVSWSPPAGDYELLYDDGIQDNFTVWSYQGNMNAVKFTPTGYPANVTGGSVNIGAQANYPPGSNPLVAFQIQIFDAAGAGGTPGNSLAGPFTVIPTAFGWVEFNFPDTVSLNNGSFYIVMIQGGSAPDAAGIAIDETSAQFRSFSRFVTGGSPWFPAGGNFMIRAKCNGSGGPQALSDEPASCVNYKVFRLRQGEEQNTAPWSFIGYSIQPESVDPSWNSLPCGPYRWGIQAGYPGNHWSAVTFTNVIGKCWTTPVAFQLITSCAPSNPQGASLRLINMAYPDTVYQWLADSIGTITFPEVWKGTYKLTVIRFGYDTIIQTIPVINPVSWNINLLQVKMPPENLTINDSSLMARWDVPHYEKRLFSENWSSGSFALNSWTTEPAFTNWAVSATFGNPAPSVTFSSMPQQIGYSHSLISKTIQGVRSRLLKLRYDVFLDNFGTTTVNQMAVEIWNGNAWTTFRNYSNSGGNIPWTSDDLDISSVTGIDFKIRFRASGGDSGDINQWNVDNISVIASEPAQQQSNCILGYYFYLGNVITGYTTKNAFPIPPGQVQFGQTYNACVRALYGSGYSDFSCANFTALYLCPVRNIQGNPIESAAYIVWEKPAMINDTLLVTPPGLIGYNIYRNDSLIAQINDPDSLLFYDYNLDPGVYRYGISAKYDLTAYGFPGLMGESLSAGPLHITITWGRQLPFFEPWDAASFNFNDWRFSPNQGNWVIDMNEGIPSPAACFRWQSPLVNYNVSLESPAFNGLPYTCAAIWLDFVLKLTDRNSTGTEKMVVEVYYGNMWHKKAEIKNLGNISWTSYHLDISPVRGKGFRIRFRATGINSADIVNWLVDNISVNPVCYPATSLTGEPIAGVVKLTWSAPVCHSGILLREGFESNVFPPVQWTEIITNLSANWSQFPIYSPIGVHSGYFSAGLNWDYNHQDEWLIAENVYVNGDLTFWSYAFQGSSHLDHYYVKVSTDQGASWNVALDLSALPTYPGTNGFNDWETPYHIDLSAYTGETIDIAWHAVDGDGNGLWYPWAIDDCSIGMGDMVYPGTSKNVPSIKKNAGLGEFIGYDVYRQTNIQNDFTLINPSPVSDTIYIDSVAQPGQYSYFIQSRFSECEYVSNSDTILIDVITGMNMQESAKILVFPNPAD
ncbi:MAG: choice-of-anchor J domain-containing protein, partial [Bacteroidota bacterium]